MLDAFFLSSDCIMDFFWYGLGIVSGNLFQAHLDFVKAFVELLVAFVFGRDDLFLLVELGVH